MVKQKVKKKAEVLKKAKALKKAKLPVKKKQGAKISSGSYLKRSKAAKPNKSADRFLVTAALPYANGDLHIGHLLEYVQADIYSRFLKLRGEDALYICASDMHGTPIEMNASKAGMQPKDFAEKFLKEHKKDFALFEIEFDNYYNTNSPENKELAEHFYSILKKKNLIYLKKIKAVHCEKCKRSLPDRFVKGRCPKCSAEDQYGDVCEKCGLALKGVDLLDPYCAICKSKPVMKEAEHYFFKLSAFDEKLRKWVNDPKAEIQPEIRNWIENWLNNLEDWCVSRDAPYFGFEIPDSVTETGQRKYFYVWLDAPIGYISSTKNYCESHRMKWKDYWYKGKVQHFVGKDIAYFHFLFWPAMLMAAGIPLPKLNVHGFVTVNGEKMSKSRGTFITLKDFSKLYPVEPLRFYYASHLDRKVVDVDLNLVDFQNCNNCVLVGNLANFCYRTLTFAQKNYGSVKKIASDKELEGILQKKSKEIAEYYQSKDYKNAVRTFLEISDAGNAYFQKAEPWRNPAEAEGKVGLCANVVRDLAIMVLPVMPQFSKKVLAVFGEKTEEIKSGGWKKIHLKWTGKLNVPELPACKIECLAMMPNSAGKEDKEENGKKEDKEKKDEKKTFPVQMRCGRIAEVSNHPNADSLYLLKVDFGGTVKQVVAGLRKYFAPEVLSGKKAVFCTNLKPAKIRGEASEAMILVADDGSKLSLLNVGEKVQQGAAAEFEGTASETKEISFEEFKKLILSTDAEGRIMFEGRKLWCAGAEVKASGVKEGARIG